MHVDRRTPTRLRARRVGLLAVSGLLLSLLSAGLCAYFDADAGIGAAGAFRSGERLTDRAGREVFPFAYGESPAGTLRMRFRAADRFGVTIAIADVYKYDSFTPASDPPPKPPTPEFATRFWERRLMLPWLYGDRSWPRDGESSSVWLKLAGWPMRSLYCELTAENSRTANAHTWTAVGGFVIGNATAPGWADWPPLLPRIVPYRPVWVGLLANTVFFAVLLGAVWYLPGWILAERRARAGLCRVCAYDLRGSPAGGACPECGTLRGG